MLNKKIKIFDAFALLLMLCGFSFAQDGDGAAPFIQPISPDSIPQGFAAQIKVEQAPPAPEAAPSVPKTVEPVVLASSSSSVKTPYKFYEDYLDSVMMFARDILPGKEKYEASKLQISEETPEPQGQYESQSRYEKRIAGFGKEKKTKLRNLENKYEADEKKKRKKLKEAVNYSKDIQPEWDGVLKQDTTVEGYQSRIARLKDKIYSMQRRTELANETLTNLGLLSEGELGDMAKKNLLYITRLERACELLQNYILQDYSRVLSTERKNFGIVLADYDPDKEEYQFIMGDPNSLTVPFEYAGIIKMSPDDAEIIDRKTDDFLASVDYINYPFILYGKKLYPGAKKAHIFYKNTEIPNTGYFKNVTGFDIMQGYADWAVFADSLISGKLKIKNLDSSYAMKKVKVGPPYWNAKRILRATAFVLSATSLGIGIWQDNEAKSKAKNANKLYAETLGAAKAENKNLYDAKSKAYEKEVDGVQSSEYMRNGFYISAGVFGVAGLVTFFF